MKKTEGMDEYSIATLLEALADDDLERKMIQLISEGFVDEELLKKILEEIGRKQK